MLVCILTSNVGLPELTVQCRTPVIISDQTGAKEMIKENSGIVIPGFDKEVWKKEVTEAVKRNFNIPENLSYEYKLSVDSHCEKMITHFINHKKRGA